MLKKTRRLNISWNENQQFFREFSIYRGNYLTIYFRNASVVLNGKTAVVVGKKVSLLAVVRNKIKRQIYALIEKSNLAKLKKDIVVVVNKIVAQDEYLAELKKFSKGV